MTAAIVTTELSSPGFTEENKQVQIIWKVTWTLQATEHTVHLEWVLMHKQPNLLKPNKTLSNPSQITLSKKQMKKEKFKKSLKNSWILTPKQDQNLVRWSRQFPQKGYLCPCSLTNKNGWSTLLVLWVWLYECLNLILAIILRKIIVSEDCFSF